jgi:glucose-6-phosphate isomerase
MPKSLLTRFIEERLPSRIWGRQTTAFVSADAAAEAHASIRNRLGWLDAPVGMRAQIGAVEDLVNRARQDGLTHVYLLGMGGSSLCAEVLRDVGRPRSGGARLTVLDTTDERTIREVTEALDPASSLFIVSSKSGSTIEVTSLESHFWSVMSGALHAQAGRHFIAITDPNTSLGTLASARGYRHVFINPPDIGGRYSALSLFGLVPAAFVGLDITALLDNARAMADECRKDDASNPGLELGVFLASHALEGRDKLTVLAPDALAPLGVWIEQLVAESTGKNGRGVLPVVGETLGRPADYGQDRAFVAVLTPGSDSERALADALETAGHPVFRIDTDASHLGAEFFRWEFATAVIGAGIGVNPFDEPNVRAAKTFTQAQLDARKATGSFRLTPALEPGTGHSHREHRATDPGAADGAGRFIAILDYLPADPTRQPLIARLRAALRHSTHVATTHGIGPRYLHSTGQYHKGGPNTGTFVLVTAADTSATPVPGTDYTFSTLKQAQALGDFDALAAAGRQVMHFHLDDPTADHAAELERIVAELP